MVADCAEGFGDFTSSHIGMKISQLSIGANFKDAAIHYLSKLPDDEVITVGELSAALGRPVPSQGLDRAKLSEYGCVVLVGIRHKVVYGNRKAIAALKKKLASNALL